MSSLHETLLGIEATLGAGDGDAYRRHLAPDATVVVPGAVLDRDSCAAAMDESPGWDEHEIAGARTSTLGDDAALLTYRWRSRRGEDRYSAVMSSVYVRRDGTWLLLLHQQTPDPS